MLYRCTQNMKKYASFLYGHFLSQDDGKKAIDIAVC